MCDAGMRVRGIRSPLIHGWWPQCRAGWGLGDDSPSALCVVSWRLEGRRGETALLTLLPSMVMKEVRASFIWQKKSFKTFFSVKSLKVF